MPSEVDEITVLVPEVTRCSSCSRLDEVIGTGMLVGSCASATWVMVINTAMGIRTLANEFIGKGVYGRNNFSTAAGQQQNQTGSGKLLVA